MKGTDIDTMEDLLAVYEAAGFGSLDLRSKGFVYPDGRLSKPDHIGHGVLGANVFALELYRCTTEPRLLKDLFNFAKRLKAYTDDRPTNNYSLLKGRSGVAWFYLELFELSGEQQLLDWSIELMKGYWEGKGRQLCLNDQKGLEGGTAGMVLFDLRLYQLIKEDWLREMIEKLLWSLIGRLHAGQSGVYWNPDLFQQEKSAIWAGEEAAAALCCYEAGRYFDNRCLCSLAQDVLDYAFGTARGTTPLSIGDRFVKTRVSEPAVRQPVWEVDELVSTTSSPGLYNGLAGWGIGLKELFAVTGNPEYLESAKRVSFELMEALVQPELCLGALDFFSGVAGIGYSVLKIVQQEEKGSLFFPRLSKHVRAAGTVLKISPVEVNKLLLQKDFGDTFSAAADGWAEEIAALLDQTFPVDQNRLDKWIHSLHVDAGRKNKYQALLAVFQREALCCRIREEGASGWIDNAAYARRFDSICTMDDKELLSLVLAPSRSGVLLRRTDPIDLHKPLTPAIIDYLKGRSGESSYFFRAGNYHELETMTLRALLLSLDILGAGCLVERALVQTVDLLCSQEKDIVNGIFCGLAGREKEDRQRELGRIILGSIRWLYALGVLDKTGNR